MTKNLRGRPLSSLLKFTEAEKCFVVECIVANRPKLKIKNRDHLALLYLA